MLTLPTRTFRQIVVEESMPVLFCTSPVVNSCGNSHFTYTSACTFSHFGMKPRPNPEMINSAQT